MKKYYKWPIIRDNIANERDPILLNTLVARNKNIMDHPPGITKTHWTNIYKVYLSSPGV